MGRALFSRRQILQAGAIGYLGLSLPRLLRADGQGTASADSCILIFLNGGPSHLDMWDMKPEAPPEVRGEFKPISTTGVSKDLELRDSQQRPIQLVPTGDVIREVLI